MPLTHIDVEVGNPARPEDTETVRFLADSGPLNSVVPTALLDSLVIPPLVELQFRLAHRVTIRRRRGGAVFRSGKRVGVADVVFGEAGDANLPGATPLESLGFGLDPLKRELIDLPLAL